MREGKRKLQDATRKKRREQEKRVGEGRVTPLEPGERNECRRDASAGRTTQSAHEKEEETANSQKSGEECKQQKDTRGEKQDKRSQERKEAPEPEDLEPPPQKPPTRSERNGRRKTQRSRERRRRGS